MLAVRWSSVPLIPYKGRRKLICAAYSLKVSLFRIFMLLSYAKIKRCCTKKYNFILVLFYVEVELGFYFKEEHCLRVLENRMFKVFQLK
jgi:hypothetical protein